jgi:hypothetical protein
MNFIQMANTRINVKTKAQRQHNALAGKLNALQEDAKTNNQLLVEEETAKRSEMISNLASQFGTSREGSKRKILAEKSRFRNELRDKLFIESVYDIFMEALVLDEDFKERYAGNFHELCEQRMSELMESGQLTAKTIETSGSNIIRGIYALCEETAKKEADEKFDLQDANKKQKLTEGKGKACSDCGKSPCVCDDKKKPLSEGTGKECGHNGPCKCPPTLSQPVKGDFDGKKSFDSKAIATAVKDKVVQVIRDEQDTAEKEQAIDDEIGNTVAPQPVDASVDTTGTDVEDTDSVDDMVTESANLRKVRRPNKVAEYSLFKSLQMNIASKNLQEMKETMSESENIELNMDLVLAEAITHYTLMETLYTSRLINPTAADMRAYAKELTLIKKK